MGKGADFERSISKRLSLWWTRGERDDVFWRTSNSGGRATARRNSGKKTKNQEGDICAIDPAGQSLVDLVSIELKKGYNSWNIKEFLDSDSKEPTLLKFFKQAQRESESKESKCWWLILRQDRRKILSVISHDFYKMLVRAGCRLSELDAIMLKDSRFGVCHFFDFDEFLKILQPEFFENERKSNTD